MIAANAVRMTRIFMIPPQLSDIFNLAHVRLGATASRRWLAHSPEQALGSVGTEP